MGSAAALATWLATSAANSGGSSSMAAVATVVEGSDVKAESGARWGEVDRWGAMQKVSFLNEGGAAVEVS